MESEVHPLVLEFNYLEVLLILDPRLKLIEQFKFQLIIRFIFNCNSGRLILGRMRELLLELMELMYGVSHSLVDNMMYVVEDKTLNGLKVLLMLLFL